MFFQPGWPNNLTFTGARKALDQPIMDRAHQLAGLKSNVIYLSRDAKRPRPQPSARGHRRHDQPDRVHAEADESGRVTARIGVRPPPQLRPSTRKHRGIFDWPPPPPQSTHIGTKPAHPADRSQTLQRAAIARDHAGWCWSLAALS
ncbi:hypothetical protein GCM10027038_15140 [Arthrobacter bambusae]